MSQVEWQVSTHEAYITRDGVWTLEAAEVIADAERARLVVTNRATQTRTSVPARKQRQSVGRVRMFCVAGASVALGGMLGVGTYAYAQPGPDGATPKTHVVHPKRRATFPDRYKKVFLEDAAA